MLCLRLIALTACRPGEACDAEWSEFDMEANLWRRPAEKMKGRRDHVSPLSTRAITLLEDLRVITGGGRYLFPHKYKPDAFATTARLCYLMRDLNVAKGARPTAGGPRSALEERRQIMQVWGDYLAMAEAENVIAFRPETAHAAR